MNIIRIAIVFSIICSNQIFAQATNTESAQPSNTNTAQETNTSTAQGRTFAGINFGVGLSFTSDTGDNDRIESAGLDEAGIVRVSKDQNEIARIMLESHYFFEPNSDGHSFLWMADAGAWGHGPFVALQPGTDEIIEAIGLGWMVGFRRSATGNDSWNLGLGYVVDPSVKILGEGVVANEPLPTGETQIRYKETSQGGVLLLVSFTF